MDSPLAWSVDELATRLGVPKSTVYYWRRKGVGPPAVRVGKYLRFRPADVEQWLDSLAEGSNGGTEAA
jgi:excisionase family DNA binding protein